MPRHSGLGAETQGAGVAMATEERRRSYRVARGAKGEEKPQAGAAGVMS